MRWIIVVLLAVMLVTGWRESLSGCVLETCRARGKRQGLVREELGRSQREVAPILRRRDLDLFPDRRGTIRGAALQFFAEPVPDHLEVQQGGQAELVQLFGMLVRASRRAVFGRSARSPCYRNSRSGLRCWRPRPSPSPHTSDRPGLVPGDSWHRAPGTAPCCPGTRESRSAAKNRT